MPRCKINQLLKSCFLFLLYFALLYEEKPWSTCQVLPVRHFQWGEKEGHIRFVSIKEDTYQHIYQYCTITAYAKNKALCFHSGRPKLKAQQAS